MEVEKGKRTETRVNGFLRQRQQPTDPLEHFPCQLVNLVVGKVRWERFGPVEEFQDATDKTWFRVLVNNDKSVFYIDELAVGFGYARGHAPKVKFRITMYKSQYLIDNVQAIVCFCLRANGNPGRIPHVQEHRRHKKRSCNAQDIPSSKAWRGVRFCRIPHMNIFFAQFQNLSILTVSLNPTSV